MGIKIGPIETRNRVFLAPMSGVTDEPFRTIAHEHGAGLVVSEMVAGEELVKARPDMLRRALGAEKLSPFVIQLAGREPHWMAEGARVAQDMGAEIIDINMGCPAREVTGGLSGSALMRNLDHAEKLIAATVRASSVPVTLKMRLGWDRNSLNAPELARRAEGQGVALVTVHGRTRCQFYGGTADWAAIARVREAVSIPLIANGDAASVDGAREMLAKSGADGVMIGRGAYGRPWWPGVIAEGLDGGTGLAEPALGEEARIVAEHHERMLLAHGAHHGNRVARKHIGWSVTRLAERHHITPGQASEWRAALLRTDDNDAVRGGLRQLYDIVQERAAA
ncbi:tRNA dihydrouridine synthase DusB [Aestuariivirga sp.]|uniref:tRNA dihydrouridine synthase DusB n=1 Tax=Aestuariivirga sp. TaxID=2650926 RepID=UPI0025BDAA8A|nr:tRNA dihydrouridine synthase DusB [Aestuariivirga sp.]MCA3554907.1 tRNA dihydrouridine synthase DusB [Aestuariivirga sp.]